MILYKCFKRHDLSITEKAESIGNRKKKPQQYTYSNAFILKALLFFYWNKDCEMA